MALTPQGIMRFVIVLLHLDLLANNFLKYPKRFLRNYLQYHNENLYLDEQKKNKVIKDVHNYNIIAIIFSPIKSIAINHCIREEEKLKLLKEIITVIQSALLL